MQSTTAATSGRTQDATAGLDRLPGRIFRFRLLGMGLAAICIGGVLLENGASTATWLMWALTCLAWPHLALLRARQSASPYRAEVHNLLLDSAIAGLWVGLMQFNLLPSVLLFTLVTVDKISTAIPRLWLWSLPTFAIGVAIGAVSTGFAFQPHTSTVVLLASLPMLLIHTIAVSIGSNRLVSKVQEKNQLLDRISRIDLLTGMHVRRHWQRLAAQTLQRHHADGEPATLMMLDVDHFKIANDRHGHAVGDEVLRAVAGAIRTHVRDDDNAGRYGGDEFGVVLPATRAGAAKALADDILREVRAIVLSGAPQSQVTISIGIAEADRRHATLEQWIETADAALYRAKRAGRDRIEAIADGRDQDQAQGASTS
ncbi:diguanylate cyclase [Luteimonas aestuarii]|uniref:diguanylate cyclase n=1 Tax=Luteimonas aestuarii TaxID=453837 RepID=UPI001A9DE245|nr:diguanylate cyclase [Luteimonas aestuarii]